MNTMLGSEGVMREKEAPRWPHIAFTDEPGQRAQYHQLYERLFRQNEGASAYRHVEDDHDRDGRILVVTSEGQCVGGARLSVKGADSSRLLPIEMDGFRLEALFPALSGKRYGQIGHVCLVPEFRGGAVMREMFRRLHLEAWSLGLTDVFGTAVMVNARAYRYICHSLGLRNTQILDVALPSYPMCDTLPFHLFRIRVDAPPISDATVHSLSLHSSIPKHRLPRESDMQIANVESPKESETNSRVWQRLADCFASAMKEFDASEPMRFVADGRFGIEHYKVYLREMFHYTRENPQLLATAASYLRGEDRKIVGLYLRHSLEEVGHDQWALRDLAALGECIDTIPYENPLPATMALNALAHYQIVHRNPLAHLGYLYFLEFLPTSSGPRYLQLLEHLGVPVNAMSFLREHVAVDEHHNALMRRYVEQLIRTEADLAAVLYAIQATAAMYVEFLRSVIKQAEVKRDWGIAWTERNRHADARLLEAV